LGHALEVAWPISPMPVASLDMRATLHTRHTSGTPQMRNLASRIGIRSSANLEDWRAFTLWCGVLAVISLSALCACSCCCCAYLSLFVHSRLTARSPHVHCSTHHRLTANPLLDSPQAHSQSTARLTTGSLRGHSQSTARLPASPHDAPHMRSTAGLTNECSNRLAD